MATVNKYPKADFYVGFNATGINEETANHSSMDEIYSGEGEYFTPELVTWAISNTSTNNTGWGAWQEDDERRGTSTWKVRRLVVSFADLSADGDLTGAASINAVKLYLYGYGSNDSVGNITILGTHYTSTPSLDEGVPASFESYTFGNALAATAGAATMPDTNAYAGLSLNTDGLTAVTNAIGGDGNVTFGVMDRSIDYGYAESDTGYINDTTNATGVFLSSYTGTSRDPYIEIDYTPASSGYGNDVNGVAAANISNVSGVATANITNVMGI